MSRATQQHYPSRAMNREDWMLYLLALAIPLGLLGYGLWRVYLGYAQFGRAAMVSWGQPWFTSAAWAVIPLFILTVRAVWFARREVLIVEQGLVPYGMGRKPIPWKHIEGLTIDDTRYHLLRLTLRTRYRVRLLPTTGKPITLDDRFDNLHGLAEAIKKRCFPRLLPELRAQLQANQWVYFGPLRFNRTQLEMGKRCVPWQQVHSLHVQAGMLVVELDGNRPVRILSAKIPNVELLLQLVEELYTGQ